MFRVLAWQAARGLLVQRRTLLIVLLALAPVVVALLLGSGAVGTPASVARAVFTGLTLPIIVPVIAVVLGTGALGSEIEDGTIVHLLARPVGRGWIVLAKAVVAAGGSVALGVAAAGLSTVVLTGFDSIQLVLALVTGAAAGAAAYATVFVALSAWTSRALMVGLGYVLIWEASIAGLFPGTRLLSIRVYAEGIAAGLAGPNAGDLSTDVALLPALVLVGIVVAAALRLGSGRLRSIEVSQAA